MSPYFHHGYALLIGINENQSPEFSLPVIQKDILALEKVLINPDMCAYKKDHIVTVLGKESTRTGIVKGIEWLRNKLAQDKSGNTTALIFYSGHGWRDEGTTPPGYYLVPYDACSSNLHLSSLRADDFASEIETIKPSRLLVILDCCHAGGMRIKGQAISTKKNWSAIPVSTFAPL